MAKTRRITASKLNKLVDDLLHPYFTDYPALIITDSLLHAIIEQDPKTSMRKSIKYNLPKLVENLMRNRKAHASATYPCYPDSWKIQQHSKIEALLRSGSKLKKKLSEKQVSES